MTPLTPVMMVMRGLILHPLLCMVLISGVVFGVFLSEGLVGESIAAIRKFCELDCECKGV